jgi:hypothetical protein
VEDDQATGFDQLITALDAGHFTYVGKPARVGDDLLVVAGDERLAGNISSFGFRMSEARVVALHAAIERNGITPVLPSEGA